MPAYGTAAGVANRVGRSSTLTATSSPSTTDVEAWLDETEAELLGAIQQGGGPSSFVADSRGALQVRGWVEQRVAGLLRQANAGAGGDGANDDGERLEDRWQTFLAQLRTNAGAILGGLADNGTEPTASVKLASHATDPRLGLSTAATEPLFTIEKGRLGGNF